MKLAQPDMFGVSPVQPETRKEKKAKQALPLRMDTKPETMVDLWKKRASSIESKRIHWTASGSTKHVACGVPVTISSGSILVELVNCEACQLIARKEWDRMVGQYRRDDVEDDE